jgi:hypothetical protein
LKKVAHGVDEDAPGRLPPERLFKFLGNQAQVETLLIGVTRYTSETLGKDLRIAMLASRAYLGAPAHRIPSCIGPFDFGLIRHFVFYSLRVQ